MELKEIIKLAGVEISTCDEGFGGKWAYREAGSCARFCGYKSEKAVIATILKSKFGGPLGELCLKLLKKHETKESKQNGN